MYFMWTKSGQICVWPKCVIGHRADVAQYVVSLWIPVRREFEINQRFPLFPYARNCTLIGEFQ